MNVSTTTRNELFSKLFTERLVNQATQFYVKTKTQQSQLSVDRLSFQADSILNALNRVTYSAARDEDLNLNLSRKEAMVGSEFASRDKTILMTMYAEVVKNLEMAKMTLAQDTPIIQVVDTPDFPLTVVKTSKLRMLIAGGVVGAFLAMLLLVLRKEYIAAIR